jgi:uncharacterized protein (TIGR02466 family)
MVNNNVHNIWSVSIFTDTIQSDYNWLQNAKSLEYKRMFGNNGAVTIDKNVLELPEFSNLKNKILSSFEKYVYDFLSIKKDVKFKFLNSWIVKHKKDDIAQSHMHSNSVFSGCYYLLHKPGNGDIVFQKENSIHNITYPNILFNYEKLNAVNCESYPMKCHQDLLIFFPSHIKHSVEKNEIEIDRYCLAFNLFPVLKSDV